MDGKVTILTGAPATGKSSLAQLLKTKLSHLESIDYGMLLLLEKQKTMPDLTYDELRARSADLITTKDVADMDERLIEWVRDKRKEAHIIIDTHGVTKEDFGFRLTPFNYAQVVELKLDAVFSLYCDPDTIQERIGRAPEGRPQISVEEALMHSQLQNGIASLYGVLSGCPVFFLDSSGILDELCETTLKILQTDLGIQ
jgi:adenylate kinase